MHRDYGIEWLEGSFLDLVSQTDLSWAYGVAPHYSVMADFRDSHVHYRDPRGQLLGVLTFRGQGRCELKWLKIHPTHQGQLVAGRLLDAFLERAHAWDVWCMVLADGNDRLKVEQLLRTRTFVPSTTNPHEWARDADKTSSTERPG